MNGVSTVIATICVMLVGARTLAADSVTQSTMSKRQLIAQTIACVRQQMSARKTISYNEAMKVCRDQVNNQSDSSAAPTLVASHTLAKP